MPNSIDDRPPIRLLTRSLAELQTSIMAQALPLFAGSVDRFAIFSLLFGQSLRADPGEERPISVLAIASSLSKPFETVRRNVGRLAAEGYCRIGPAGIAIAPEVTAQPEVAALTGHTHDSMVRFIAALTATGGATGAVSTPTPAPYRMQPVLLAASDLMLAIADNNKGAHETFCDLVIFSAVLACNYRAITLSPSLSLSIRNETHPVPADLVRDASPSWIAHALGLPETTVRRRMKMMLRGPLTMTGRRFSVLEEWLNTPEAIAISRTSYGRVRRMMADLALAGFPFDHPDLAFVGGKPPPYVTFG